MAKEPTVQTTITLKTSSVVHVDTQVLANGAINRSQYIDGLIRKDMGLDDVTDESEEDDVEMLG